MQEKIVKTLKLSNGKDPVLDWFAKLDLSIRTRLGQRLQRLRDGNLGDFKKLTPSISELRFNFGSGYRIYYTEIDEIILLLVNGGDKTTQKRTLLKLKNCYNNGEKKMMKEYKNTGTLDELILSGLKTEQDIKEWLDVSFAEYINDGNFKMFYSSLELAIKAKDTISGISKKTGISRSNLYAMFKGEQLPKFDTVMKIFKALGYTLKVA